MAKMHQMEKKFSYQFWKEGQITLALHIRQIVDLENHETWAATLRPPPTSTSRRVASPSTSTGASVARHCIGCLSDFVPVDARLMHTSRTARPAQGHAGGRRFRLTVEEVARAVIPALVGGRFAQRTLT